MDLIKKIDPRDIVCIIGLSLLGTGLWWLEPWISLVTTGTILVVLSIIPDIVVLKRKRR